MKAIQIIAGLVLIVQLANLINVLLNSGIGHGAGLDTFLAGMNNPWQNFINSDLVMGLLFSLSWLVFRERRTRLAQTVAWVWMAAWWGNIVIAAYVLRSAADAQGDWAVFFMGRGQTRPARVKPLILRAAALAGAAAVLIYLVHGLLACHFALVPAVGYLAGFLPIALSLALVARPHWP